MSDTNVSKKLWIVVEPTVYIHSGIFIGAILRNEDAMRKYDVRFMTSNESVAIAPVTREIRNEFGDDFSFHHFGYPGFLKRSWFLESLAQAWRALASICHFSDENRKVDFATVLWVDRLVQLMAVPFVPSYFRKLRGKVSGIFFNPRCFRETGFKARLYRFLILRGIRSGYFHSLQFLDHGACDLVRKHLPERFHGIVRPGVDPWPGVLHEPRPLKKGRLNFLTFGAHSERKGTLKLLQMLRDHPDETSCYHLSIVGSVRDDIREEFEALLGELGESRQRVTVEDRFVADDEMVAYFKSADVILCPYVDFHGSSNVVIRAAAHQLPVVVPPFSYLQEVVSEMGIGEVAVRNSPKEILRATQKIESNLRKDPGFYRKACEDYAKIHHESRFAESLLPSFKN